MANEEHLSLIRQGVDVWNRWRKENLGVWPDLSGAELNGEILIGAKLSGANLKGAKLIGVRLDGANLIDADLSEANLAGAYLSKANLAGTNFIDAYLHQVDFRGSYINAKTHIDHKWRLVWKIVNQGAIEIDLRGTDLSGADLSEMHLQETNLSNANLSDALLGGSFLNKANLSGTNLKGTELTGADLSGADLSGAKLTGAYLIGANFSRANLNGADFTRVIVGHNIFGDVDLRAVEGLETIKHTNPSMIGIETIYRSAGNIFCRSFLHEAGVPLHLIDYIEKTRSPADCFYTFEQIENWISEAKKRLRVYQDNKNVVKERMAQKGAFKDVPDVNELTEYEGMIKKTEDEIIELQQHQEKGCPVCTGKASVIDSAPDTN